jgi:hypothetical protein
MPEHVTVEERTARTVTRLLLLMLVMALLLAVLAWQSERPAGAQSATYAIFPGNAVEVSLQPRQSVTRELVTSCGYGDLYAIAGGWRFLSVTAGKRGPLSGDITVLPLADWTSYNGTPGERTLVVRVTAGATARTVLLVPYVTCASGEQLPG